MTKDKQIEEMVRAVCIQMRDYPKLTCKKCKADNRSTNAYCRVQFEMERLYNAGYRKASEVAMEIIADLVKFADDKERQMSFHGHSVWHIAADDVTDFIAELKKKYTEEVK